MDKKICRRCLLDDLDFDEYMQSLKDYIKAVPPDSRVSDEVYSSRLDVCRSCEELANAMCRQCGCYVELRALKPKTHCPIDKWGPTL